MPNPKYKTLNKLKPELDLDRLEQLEILYKGEEAIAKCRKRFLPKLSNELEPHYEDRLKSVSYINYMSNIIGKMVTDVFRRDVSVSLVNDSTVSDDLEAQELPAFYEAFSDDVDGSGTTLTQLAKDCLTDALVQGKAHVIVNLPKTEDLEIASLAQEELSGSDRAYVQRLPISSLINWNKDTYGNYSFAVIKQTLSNDDNPFEECIKYKDRFSVWVREENKVRVVIFESEEYKASERPDDESELSLVDEIETSFKLIPIVDICLPSGLWAGNKVGPLNHEHYIRRSTLVSSQNRSLNPVALLQLGTESVFYTNDDISEVQKNPSRFRTVARELERKGMVTIGSGDQFSYVEPEGKAFEIVDNQLKQLVDEMYRITHQMADSISSTSLALHRSGDSKRADRKSSEIIAGALASIVKEFVSKLFRMVSLVRSEDDMFWNVHGLERDEQIDPETVIELLKEVRNIGIPSETAIKALYKQHVGRLIDTNAEVLAQIHKEIDAANLHFDATESEFGDLNIEETEQDSDKPAEE